MIIWLKLINPYLLSYRIEIYNANPIDFAIYFKNRDILISR